MCWARRTRGTLRGAVDELFPDVIERALGECPEPWSPDEPAAYCPRCGASAGPGAVMRRGCAFCLDTTLAWDRITRLGAYAPPLDEYVRRMKLRRQWRWAEWFGDRMAEAVGQAFDESRVAVCPVPMHWARCWSRGFNQAALMAERVAQRRGWLFAPLLRRRRATLPQAMLPVSRRLTNLRGAIAPIEAVDLRGWEVLLVDDVKTTGATLHACARRLRRAGARSVHVAVTAVADRHHMDFKALRPRRSAQERRTDKPHAG